MDNNNEQTYRLKRNTYKVVHWDMPCLNSESASNGEQCSKTKICIDTCASIQTDETTLEPVKPLSTPINATTSKQT